MIPLACVIALATAPAQKAIGAPVSTPGMDLALDLSATSDVRAVLVMPPTVRQTTNQGGFVGFDAKKVTEKYDFAAHKRLVTAFSKELEGRVLSAETTVGALQKEGIVAAASRTGAAIAKIAKATNVDWVVTFEFNKTGALVGTVWDADGQPAGEPSYVTGASAITQKHADDMARFVVKQLAVVAKKKAEAREKAQPVVESPSLPSPPEHDVHDAELLALKEEAKEDTPSFFRVDPARTRLAVTVGPGAVTRGFTVSGDSAADLAELRTGGAVGLGVYAMVSPLQFFEKTAGKRWSDLELEVHYRRAFVRANGVAGAVEGQPCTMTDDDLQVRGTYRYKLGDGFLPSVGLGGGWSQEQTLFACTLPLVSTSYRGIDAQLRVRQPLFRDILALELAIGPRLLMPGATLTRPGFSIAGEAWLELKPYSFLFTRGGARFSHLQAANDTLSVVDTRTFFALELGAYL